MVDILINKHLGKLCKRGHDWGGKGKSLRYNGDGKCCECVKMRLKLYYLNHKKESLLQSKEWRIKNREKSNAICKKYRDSHKTERYVACTSWRINNWDKANKIQKRSNKKIRKTLKGNLNHRVSVAVQQSLVNNKQGRKWESLVGYSMNQLKEHLESLFTAGMTWERFLKGEIHIDHLIPINFFHFNSPDDLDFQTCWSLENLRPLWAVDNRVKHTALP